MGAHVGEIFVFPRRQRVHSVREADDFLSGEEHYAAAGDYCRIERVGRAGRVLVSHPVYDDGSPGSIWYAWVDLDSLLLPLER
jgi:hypothetical protein